MPAANGKKKKQQSRDSAVQGTNDSSVLSKVSAAAQGYFQDDFLQHFVCKVSRRAPLINRGYYVRWRAVDHCVRRFLRVTERCPSRQILSLGAGFDSLYFRLHAGGLLDGAVVFEVDFPDVARRKAALIGSNGALKGALDSPLESPTAPVFVCSGRYRLLGADVRAEAPVAAALEAARLDRSVPTLILSEVVLTYMETRWSDAVIRWTAKLLPQSLFVMYEQINPHDPFGRIMQNHFLRLNSALHAVQRYPDTPTQTRRFLDQGWEECVCLDMNTFYLQLLPEEERRRAERLEPFDEHEEWHQKCSHYFILTASRGRLAAQALLAQRADAPAVCPSWSSAALRVRVVPVGTEGLGMASSLLSAGLLLLTGGSSRGGRGSAARLLLRAPGGWRSVSAEPSADLGVRLHHSATSLPGGGVLVYGGRSSPLSPSRGLFRVAPLAPPTSEPASGETLKLCVEEMICTGDPPPPRWRHTATVVSHGGKDFLFVFGGKNESEAVLGDGHFLCAEQQRWTEIPVGGGAPEARHSHSACSYGGGAVLFGGLGRGGAPLGDTAVLRPNQDGFSWETLEVEPAPVPRFSHCAHVIGEKLLLLGGVWLHSDGVPGAAVIDLATRSSTEYRLDLSAVPWPLMLQSFCSELVDAEEPELHLIGGGGNCFSFGTHLNPQPVSLDLRPVLG